MKNGRYRKSAYSMVMSCVFNSKQMNYMYLEIKIRIICVHSFALRHYDSILPRVGDWCILVRIYALFHRLVSYEKYTTYITCLGTTNKSAYLRRAVAWYSYVRIKERMNNARATKERNTRRGSGCVRPKA